MYRKKELIFIGVITLGIIIFFLFNFFKRNEKNSVDSMEPRDFIHLKIEGEIARPVELQYIKPISYGVLFLRIKNSLNEYSDLSHFDLEDIISTSRKIYIPTYDIGNQYSSGTENIVLDKIYIHTATLEELKKLPQIGEKRGQKILDYISSNGKIESWDVFFKIVSVPESAKEEIQNKAIL